MEKLLSFAKEKSRVIMSSYSYFILFIVMSFGLYTCSFNEIKEGERKDTLLGKELNISASNDDFVKEKIKIYSDSLNLMLEGNFPFFIKDVNFDVTNYVLWRSTHLPLSLRKIIIDSIDNEVILDKLIQSSICSIKPRIKDFNSKKIPYSDYSYKELALMKKQELLQRQSMNDE